MSPGLISLALSKGFILEKFGFFLQDSYYLALNIRLLITAELADQ